MNDRPQFVPNDTETTVRRQGLDASKRRPLFWWATFAVVGTVGVSSEFLAELLCPLWFDIKPRPTSIGGWLLGTPAEWFAPWLSFLALYLPEIVVLTGCACVIGRLLPNSWGRWLTTLLVAFAVTSTLRVGGPWTYVPHSIRSGRFDNAIGCLWMSFVILGLPYVAAWAVARFGTPVIIAADRCGNCGYPRIGLPSDICPECGKKLPPIATSAEHRAA